MNDNNNNDDNTSARARQLRVLYDRKNRTNDFLRELRETVRKQKKTLTLTVLTHDVNNSNNKYGRFAKAKVNSFRRTSSAQSLISAGGVACERGERVRRRRKNSKNVFEEEERVLRSP